jgi:uncharacterized protein (TIGR00251 family)
MGFLWQYFGERQLFFLENRHLLASCLYSTIARRDVIVGLRSDYLKVRITAPPIEEKANAHLLKFLAEVFGVGHHQIEITAGNNCRHKLLRIQNPSRLPDGLFQESTGGQFC